MIDFPNIPLTELRNLHATFWEDRTSVLTPDELIALYECLDRDAKCAMSGAGIYRLLEARRPNEVDAPNLDPFSEENLVEDVQPGIGSRSECLGTRGLRSQ